jgi:hypothetical protein
LELWRDRPPSVRNVVARARYGCRIDARGYTNEHVLRIRHANEVTHHSAPRPPCRAEAVRSHERLARVEALRRQARLAMLAAAARDRPGHDHEISALEVPDRAPALDDFGDTFMPDRNHALDIATRSSGVRQHASLRGHVSFCLLAGTSSTRSSAIVIFLADATLESARDALPCQNDSAGDGDNAVVPSHPQRWDGRPRCNSDLARSCESGPRDESVLRPTRGAARTDRSRTIRARPGRARRTALWRRLLNMSLS